MKNLQKGFIVPLLLLMIAILIIGGGTYVYVQNKQWDQPAVGSPTTQTTATTETSNQPAQMTPAIRAQANDAEIKSNMLSVQTRAEIYYGVAGNTYIGVCTDHNVAATLAEIQTVNGGTTSTCNSSAKAYAVSSPLFSDNTKFLCVDSTGKMTQTAILLGTKTACSTQSTNLVPTKQTKASPLGAFSVSPSSLSYNYVKGGPEVLYQYTTLTNTSNANIVYTESVSIPSSWLHVTFTRGSAAPGKVFRLGAFASPLFPVVLSPGTYDMNIIITGNFVDSPLLIPATLTIPAQ